MLKSIACVVLSVVAFSSAGCVDPEPPAIHPVSVHVFGEEVHVTGGWIEEPPCAGCSLVHGLEVTVVLDKDGAELCRIGPTIDTCGLR